MSNGCTGQDIAECFADFFVHKIMKIQNELDQCALNEPGHRDGLTTLNMFNPVSDDIVKKLMRQMKCTSCELDLIPTKIIKEHLYKFAPLLSLIVKKITEWCMFSDRWKIALVRPLIKKCNLDRIDKNYRPDSNLAFISKLIEGAVLDQLNQHCTYNDIHSLFQST